MLRDIHLTEQQRQAIEAGQGRPVEVIDPVTSRVYVLLAAEAYDRLRAVREGATRGDERPEPAVPAGIRRSQAAFWRDLSALLRDRGNRGRWVAYHGDERVGIGSYEELIRECLRRGLGDDAYDLEVIEPHALPPWEPEEIEPGGHEAEEEGSGPGDEPA
jgi:hypothetical protein